jgi:hypothetical protein
MHETAKSSAFADPSPERNGHIDAILSRMPESRRPEGALRRCGQLAAQPVQGFKPFA